MQLFYSSFPSGDNRGGGGGEGGNKRGLISCCPWVGTQHRDKIIPAPDKNAILMRPHHLKFPAGDHVWRHRCGRSVILVTTAIVKY